MLGLRGGLFDRCFGRLCFGHDCFEDLIWICLVVVIWAGELGFVVMYLLGVSMFAFGFRCLVLIFCLSFVLDVLICGSDYV